MEKNHIATFPVAFQDGMYAPWRARALGDLGSDDPHKWYWGGSDNQIDAIMLIYAADEAKLTELGDDRRKQTREFGIEIVQEVTFKPLPKSNEPIREPFGFVDGVSQPVLRGVGRWTMPKNRNQLIEPGEIILGYRDNSGYLPSSPTVSADDDPENLLPGLDSYRDRQRLDFSVPQNTGQKDLGCNGTFLVVRQLEQDVDKFDAFLNEAAKSLTRNGRMRSHLRTSPKEWIAAKMVGRWRKDGTSLVRHPQRPYSDQDAKSAKTVDPDNEFMFSKEDQTGERCPLGAHIRRANPRDNFTENPQTSLAIVNRHRILRVSRSYPPQTEGGKPGLIFMCLNADIERQFEFVQQTWVLGPNFSGLEDEVDPIVRRKDTLDCYTIPTADGPVRLKGLKEFVRVRGGGYFFLPGRKTVQFLCCSKTDDRTGTQLVEGLPHADALGGTTRRRRRSMSVETKG
jgi:Dyp-type peroxidase family